MLNAKPAGISVQRLFSMFPDRWPGAALLLLTRSRSHSLDAWGHTRTSGSAPFVAPWSSLRRDRRRNSSARWFVDTYCWSPGSNHRDLDYLQSTGRTEHPLLASRSWGKPSDAGACALREKNGQPPTASPTTTIAAPVTATHRGQGDF